MICMKNQRSQRKDSKLNIGAKSTNMYNVIIIQANICLILHFQIYTI